MNLTAFSLLFPEKRDFFSKDRGCSRRRCGGRQPALPPATIRRAGRATHRRFSTAAARPQAGRAVHDHRGGVCQAAPEMEHRTLSTSRADDDPIVNAARTDFTVLSVRRRLLKRSAIGALFTQRSKAYAIAPAQRAGRASTATSRFSRTSTSTGSSRSRRRRPRTATT